jgi:hypothetical protein
MGRFPQGSGYLIFEQIAVTPYQVTDLDLPIRKPKRKSPADKAWPYDFACELDAIEPDALREMVEQTINIHLDQAALDVLKVAERSEREILKAFARNGAALWREADAGMTTAKGQSDRATSRTSRLLDFASEKELVVAAAVRNDRFCQRAAAHRERG